METHVAEVKVILLTSLILLISNSFCPEATGQTGPGHAKTCLMPYANNKGADQPVHPRSLISPFVVRFLDSMICILAISKVSRL